MKKKKRVTILSNGIKFLDFAYCKELKSHGLDLVMLQFDSLNDEHNQVTRNESLVENKLKVISNLTKANIPVIVVSTMVKGRTIEELDKYIPFMISQRGVIGIGLNEIMRTGRYDENHFVPTSKIIEKMCKALKISKHELIKTTELLINLDLLFSPFLKKRFRSKCGLIGLVMKDGNQLIPLGKIIELEKVNSYFRKILNEKSRIKKVNLFLLTLLEIAFFNFFRNKNYRIFLWNLVKRIPRVTKHPYFINPLVIVTLFTFPTFENIDPSFEETCNFISFSETDEPLPACLRRCLDNKKFSIKGGSHA